MQTLGFRLWFALAVVAGCHFGDSPGLLGKYTAEQAAHPEPDAQTGEAADSGERAPASMDAGRAADPEPKPARADAGRAGPSTSASADACVNNCDDAGSTPPDPDPTVRPSDWTMLGYDLASTYNNSAERVLAKSNAGRLRLKFSVDLGREVYGAPLLVGGRLYVNGGNQARSYDLATGNEIWRMELGRTSGQTTVGTMAYDEGMVYLQQLDGTVVAVSADSGKELWRAAGQASSNLQLGYSSPIVAGGLTLVGQSNDSEPEFRGNLMARQKRDGFLVWTTYTVGNGSNGAGVWSTPSVDLARDMIYVTTALHITEPADSGAGAIIALSLSEGRTTFINQLQEPNASPPPRRLISGYGANPVLYSVRVGGESLDLLAAGSRQGTVSALRRVSGEYAWTAKLGEGNEDGSAGIYANTSWSGKHILVAHNEGLDANSSLLTALDGANGKQVWQRRLSGLVLGRITIANGVGFVGASAAVEIFDVESGTSLASLPTGGATAAGVASIANGIVAFGTGARVLNGVAQGAKVFVYEVAP